MNTERTERGWRGTPDLWLDAAYALLVEGGVEAVKVMPLAERLGLSRTSFYWHFPDREALLAGLVMRWQAKNTGNLVARCETPAATIAEALLNLFDCWYDDELFDSRLEFAMRTWSLTDTAVAAAMSQADATRVSAITALFRRFGYGEAEADTRARTLYLTQVGYIAVRSEEDLAVRMERNPAYVLTFSGVAPTEAEDAAFRARHTGG
ncbi:TetR/AcrR family transcriptional regulator [Tabrizicola sp.]|jgi:AcrR family transcriptional regulator|uniref:TetR/AcrR family transcriptional regulator n=1 Tax=Tabrizicola sp. TaxID=2005166 RepID=UPI000BD09390|nr:TetR/AcrR family transcriptional regulator [Tabrizicola sp.]MBY0352043.1 TetR/AcrR family transcriptional regulator [Tabrizicola sp.]MDK2773904.1 TetR/AcrR family transcriptional regulator [Tabrizicola sp.]OYX18483.1 MAG: TetR family transcriptional regulator [Rhodobacterales bacterium 32-66-9]